jgi:hypothetical protein
MRFQTGTLATLGLLAVMGHAPSAWQSPASASDQTAEVAKLDRALSAAGVRNDLETSSRLVADARRSSWRNRVRQQQRLTFWPA